MSSNLDHNEAKARLEEAQRLLQGLSKYFSQAAKQASQDARVESIIFSAQSEQLASYFATLARSCTELATRCGIGAKLPVLRPNLTELGPEEAFGYILGKTQLIPIEPDKLSSLLNDLEFPINKEIKPFDNQKYHLKPSQFPPLKKGGENDEADK